MNSSSDSSTSSSDEELQERGNSNAMSKIHNLDERSRERYLKVYENFMMWRTCKGFQSFSEDVFMSYFKELAKTKQASTLWTTFSMLRATVSAHHGVEINTNIKLLSYLRTRSQGHIAKKSKVFSAQDIKTFLNDAPDNTYLAMKVALVFGLYGACRIKELVTIRTVDIQKHSEQVMLVNVMRTPKVVDRSFVVRDEFIKLVEKYQALRPSRMGTNRFFINYQHGKCKRQAIGINTLSTFPRRIAIFLKLPNAHMYSGHCFRRTGAILGQVQPGATCLMIKQTRRWRSDSCAAGRLLQSATMSLRPRPFRSLQSESPNKTQHESPVNNTQDPESSVNDTQFVNIQQCESLDETQQVKTECSEWPADESVKSDDRLDRISEEYVIKLSPLPDSPPPAARRPAPSAARVVAALERRRLRLDEVRARQLHAREMSRLRVEARRVEVDRERNEVLRKIADVALALLEKTMGNGGVIPRL